jgi:hypothetical protein
MLESGLVRLGSFSKYKWVISDTWDVAIELLPTSHGVTSPTPMPTYRKHPGKREVTVPWLNEIGSQINVIFIRPEQFLRELLAIPLLALFYGLWQRESGW